MPTINRSALVPYSAGDMYELVLDVAQYPEFLPWCSAAKVHIRDETSQTASVTISSVLQQNEFTTENTLSPNEEVRMKLVDGPFRVLQGQWRFIKLAEQACKVELEIEFEFASSALSSAIKPVFTQVASSLIDAYVAEAGRRFAS